MSAESPTREQLVGALRMLWIAATSGPSVSEAQALGIHVALGNLAGPVTCYCKAEEVVRMACPELFDAAADLASMTPEGRA